MYQAPAFPVDRVRIRTAAGFSGTPEPPPGVRVTAKAWEAQEVRMLLQFNCTCGRALEVPSSMGGRRVRCPACLAIVTAPETTISAADVPEARLADDPAEQPVRTAAEALPTPSATLSAVLTIVVIAFLITGSVWLALASPEIFFFALGFAGLAVVALILAGRRPGHPFGPVPLRR